jgi:nitroreductase
METLKTIAQRKSTRAFSPDKPIAKADLDMILAAGCAAPVGKADYPSIHLTVIQDKAALTNINTTIQAALKVGQNLMYGAPVLVLVCASDKQISPNIQYSNVGCVIENMLLAATDAGIDSVYLWGAVGVIAGNAGLCTQLGIPDGFAPVSAVALGYAAQKNPAEKQLGITFSVNYV